MIEIPEACVIAGELKDSICDRKILSVKMNSTPHKFAFYTGEVGNYSHLLIGKYFDDAVFYGGMVELKSQSVRLVFSDGVKLRMHEKGSKLPQKHQMLLEFSDGLSLSASIQMYGGLWCFEEGTFENDYRSSALKKPSPLCPEFNEKYFSKLIETDRVQKISLKAFLATEQRIPGFGNGVLQDILWSSKLHPKRKVGTLEKEEKDRLFCKIKELLKLMAMLGGRDTEEDIFGQHGGYLTRMSRLHAHEGCAVCGGEILKEPYMGGSIYYCPICQEI
ncbi:endonuclease VIII [Alkalibacter mobilis]|uniref:endonuclease VIII n=1 Tax=Alkalibacter mobilis TaxID=2787712 RepID=UPI00189F0A98|nr:endonuclease VIII [Alkalibacter mobilis]MBF7097695.1 endonuclease VIII [Alkalibacter mobilis]